MGVGVAGPADKYTSPLPTPAPGFPERVELAPLPRWQPVGENLTMTCQVAGGAPRTNLTVVLLRGEEELSRQPAVGEPAEVTFTVAVGREDHLANFSCRTDLDLRHRGLGLFQNSSAPRQLQTFGEALGSCQQGWAQGMFLLGVWGREASGRGGAKVVT